jgi:hypothetical protein
VHWRGAALERAERSRHLLPSVRKTKPGVKQAAPGITARDVSPSAHCGNYSSVDQAIKRTRVETFAGAARSTRFAAMGTLRQKPPLFLARWKAAPLQLESRLLLASGSSSLHRSLLSGDIPRSLLESQPVQLVHGQVAEQVDPPVDQLRDFPEMVQGVFFGARETFGIGRRPVGKDGSSGPSPRRDVALGVFRAGNDEIERDVFEFIPRLWSRIRRLDLVELFENTDHEGIDLCLRIYAGTKSGKFLFTEFANEILRENAAGTVSPAEEEDVERGRCHGELRLASWVLRDECNARGWRTSRKGVRSERPTGGEPLWNVP